MNPAPLLSVNTAWRAYLKALYRTTLAAREASYQTGRCAVAAGITAKEVKVFTGKASRVSRFCRGLDKAAKKIKRKKAHR